ncbi:Prohibitin [Trichinella britovi]|uniref:Prohibitin n=1 Tax=Trichinella britovi TaxID=45882 RepID=A0A0V1CB39_TRIBR|nr:Prohibitin [Trichinella britovi]KRY46402.1 Prohibitin [Trichinella britovi]
MRDAQLGELNYRTNIHSHDFIVHIYISGRRTATKKLTSAVDLNTILTPLHLMENNPCFCPENKISNKHDLSPGHVEYNFAEFAQEQQRYDPTVPTCIRAWRNILRDKYQMQAVHNLSKNLIRFGVGLATVGAVVNSALYNVDGGQRAVIFDRFTGVKPDVVGEGTHFLIPWVQKPIVFDIRATPRNVAVVTGSKDLQNVHTTLRILFRPIPEELPKIYTNIGVDYDERILPSITNEVLKAVVAQFDAADMITHRELVSQKVNEELTERASQFGLLLDDISLTHLSFGKEFTQAVEMKQVAQQEAERARFLVEKAEQMKLAAIISAEGDAIAAELLGTAFQQSGDALIELRKIEASEEIAAQLAKQKNVTYFPPNLSPLLSIPQQKFLNKINALIQLGKSVKLKRVLSRDLSFCKQNVSLCDHPVVYLAICSLVFSSSSWVSAGVGLVAFLQV